MWDYDKLFAEGNIVGVKNCYEDKIYNNAIDINSGVAWIVGYKNDELCCKNQFINMDNNVEHSYKTDFEIQYIIRLDEHGNVIERLFDREKDMKSEPNPMPELETGMFVRVNAYGGSRIGFVDAENNHVIYQEGGYDFIDDDDINGRGIIPKIVEVYGKDTCAFDFCTKDDLIWRKPESN